MLLLLEFSLILCLVSISGEGWAKQLPPKMLNESFVASFFLESHPWCHFRSVKNERLECEITVTFRILFCILSTSYVEIILEAKISIVFPT